MAETAVYASSPLSSLSSPSPSPSTVSPSNSTTSSLLSAISSAPSSVSLPSLSNNKDKHSSSQSPPRTPSAKPKSHSHSLEDTRKTEAPPKQRSKDGYIARVGFDSLECEDTIQYAYTLQARTDHWHRTRKTRSFLVCTDLNDHSSHALQWVMENMVEDGDEIVALRVVPMELRDSFAKSGIPSFQGQEFTTRSEATKIMNMIRQKNKAKEINIIVEVLVGNVRDTIQHMIKMYEPAMLVVGTRGRNSVKGFLLGSVSRYCLNHSPIPVTVVRPASKLVKSKQKSKGIFRRRSSAVQTDPSDNEDQPEPPQLFYSSPLSRQTSRTSLDPDDTLSLASMPDLERRGSRSSDSHVTLGMNHHHHSSKHMPTAAEKASAAKRPSIFAASLIPSASINSSLSYSSALLSSPSPSTSTSPLQTNINKNNNSLLPPSTEGMVQLTKSLTTDGTVSGHWSSSSESVNSKDKEKDNDKEKKANSRRSFAKLSESILGPLGSLGGSKKKPVSSQSTSPQE